MTNTFARLAAVATLSFAALSAQADVNTYSAHGSVVAVDAADQKITVKQDALADHQQWQGIKGKISQLDRNGA